MDHFEIRRIQVELLVVEHGSWNCSLLVQTWESLLVALLELPTSDPDLASSWYGLSYFPTPHIVSFVHLGPRNLTNSWMLLVCPTSRIFALLLIAVVLFEQLALSVEVPIVTQQSPKDFHAHPNHSLRRILLNETPEGLFFYSHRTSLVLLSREGPRMRTVLLEKRQ